MWTPRHDALPIHLSPPISLPAGYHIVSFARPWRKQMRIPGGGVAAVINRVRYNVQKDLSAPDLIVLDLGHSYLISSYILPEYAKWSEWSELDPCSVLENVVFHCTVVDPKPITLMGDLNARTGSRQRHGAPLHRCSPDKEVSTRGRWLMDLLDAHDLLIVNGSTREGTPGSCASTSLQQSRGQSVIDYLILSDSTLPSLASFSIVRPHPTADHCCLSVVITGCAELKQESKLLTVPERRIAFPAATHLDSVLDDLLRKPRTSHADAISRIYGPPSYAGHAVDCRLFACVDAEHQATAACCRWSVTIRDDGCCLVASSLLALALMRLPPQKAIRLFSSSEPLVRLLAYDIVDIAHRGWSSAYRAELKLVARIMKQRTGSLDIVYTAPEDATPIWIGCMTVARQVARRAIPPTHSFPDPELERVLVTKWSSRQTRERRTPARREAMTRNLNDLVNARNSRDWWKKVKEMDAEKPRAGVVPTDVMADNFCRRMNPPLAIPDSFDSVAYTSDLLFNDVLPAKTEDVTPNLDFTRPFSTDEVDDAKRHIRARSMRSARGADNLSFRRIMEIESEDLASLFNECVRTKSCPSTWLVTILVGIQKKGKPIKFLTLLCVTRLRAWISAIGLLPDSQNGFRPGKRTHNCSFVLRAAIEKTLAEGKTLYVAFMDLTNAFPSTNRPTLWRVLYDNEARGPVIDWVRMLYERMQYVVTGGQRREFFSRKFELMWGILAGDTASPDLFNIYMASFLPPILESHVMLNGRPVSNVQQADDIVLWTQSHAGLQALVNYTVLVWCALFFLIANALKSHFMLFGWLPQYLSPIKSGTDDLAVVSSCTYAGITFQCTSKSIFALQYRRQEAQARHMSMMMFRKDGRLGTVDIASLIDMYKSQIDPHLTFGCEVVVDDNRTLAKPLEDAQVSFLRRALGLNKSSSRAMLFFITGLMPVLSRRAVLLLKYYLYVMSCNRDDYAWAAFQENFALYDGGFACWMGDVACVLRRLSPPILVERRRGMDRSYIEDLIVRVKKGCYTSIHTAVNANKTIPLLHRPPSLPLDRPLHLQPFLKNVDIPAHRRTLTLLVTGCSKLRVVLGRREKVPHANRTCRLCTVGAVEDEKHILFECGAVPMFEWWRAEFFETASRSYPTVRADLSRIGGDAMISRIIFGSDVALVQALARLSCKVYSIFCPGSKR